MKIQIVNEQDEVIGVKERSEVDYSKDIYRVSALWLTNSKNQVLLAKRAMTKDKDPGLWGPAAVGTIDEGETYDENMYKEAAEEIGLEGVELTKGIKMHIREPRNYFAQWYTAQLDRDVSAFTRQESEVDDLAWIDVDLLKEELKTTPEKYLPTMPQIVQELGV